MISAPCYSINRRSGYVTIYNNGHQYSLSHWMQLKEEYNCTHDQLAQKLWENFLELQQELDLQ